MTNPTQVTNPSTATNISEPANSGAIRAPGAIDVHRVAFARVATTPVQRAASLALQQIRSQGPLDGFLHDLAGQTVAGARQTLTRVAVGGVARAAEAQLGLRVGHLLLALPMRALRLGEGGEAGEAGAGADPDLAVATIGGGAPLAGLSGEVADLRAWAGGFGAFGKVDDPGGAGVDFSAGGGVVGLDQRLGPGLRLGLALGYARSDARMQALPATSGTDTTALLSYGNWRAGRVRAQAALGYAHGRVESRRDASLPTAQPTAAEAHAASHTNQLLSQGELGLDLPLGSLTLTPFASLQASWLWQGRTTEDGAAPLDLGLAGGSATSLRHMLGVEVTHSLELGEWGGDWGGELGGEGVAGDLGLRLGWVRERRTAATTVDLGFAAAPEASFRVEGPRPQRDAAAVGLGLNLTAFQSLSAFVRYDGELGRKDQTNTLSAGLRLVW